MTSNCLSCLSIKFLFEQNRIILLEQNGIASWTCNATSDRYKREYDTNNETTRSAELHGTTTTFAALFWCRLNYITDTDNRR